MAKSFNILTKDLRGKVGKTMVFRRHGEDTIVARYPRPLKQKKATEKQEKQRNKFQEAALYAQTVLANPAQKALYQAAPKVKQKRMSAFNAAIADYLTPPVIRLIDSSEYHGAVGDKIYFTILDDFSIQSVKVALHEGGGTLIEQGSAVKEGMRYAYTATVAKSNLTGIVVSVTATDLPKNVSKKQLTIDN